MVSPASAKSVAEVLEKLPDSPLDSTDPDAMPAFIASEIRAELNRAEALESVAESLEEIPLDQEQKLTERIRKMFPDLGKPLSRSATTLDIEFGEDHKPVATLNARRISQIVTLKRDDEVVTIHGSFVRLDKDHGFGRFRPSGSRTALPFSIPRETFMLTKVEFIRAFSDAQVGIQALPFRDGIGNISKLIIIKVL